MKNRGIKMQINIDNKYIRFFEKTENKYKKTKSDIVEMLIEKELFLQKEAKKRKRFLLKKKREIHGG